MGRMANMWCRSGTAFSVDSHIRMYLHTNSRSTPHHLQLSPSENVGYAQNGNFKGKIWSEFNPLGILWFSSNFQTIPQWSRKAAGAKPTGQSAHLRQRLLEGRVRNPRAQETWEVAGVTNLKTSNMMLFDEGDMRYNIVGYKWDRIGYVANSMRWFCLKIG
jgi:hypothetical protein